MKSTISIVALVAGLGLLVGQAAAQAPVDLTITKPPIDRRVALVIGNAAYKESPLRNPVNDARAMAAALQKLGFEVIKRENAGQREMSRAITEFDGRLSGGAVGLVYYAGHGMQVKGRNYLLPVDAQISTEASVRNESIDVDQILDGMSSAGNPLNVVILDACRNNPFERRFRGSAGGLAQVDAPKGALIAYATAPGKVAADGEGANGLYTSELLRALEEPGLRVEDVFKHVRARVATATNDLQVPWEASSLIGDFYFKIGVDKSVFELAFWQSIQSSSVAGDFQSYLDQYPNGQFSGLARSRIQNLQEIARKAEDDRRVALAEDERKRVEAQRQQEEARRRADDQRVATLEEERKRSEAERQAAATEQKRQAADSEVRKQAEDANHRAQEAEARLQAALAEIERRPKELPGISPSPKTDRQPERPIPSLLAPPAVSTAPQSTQTAMAALTGVDLEGKWHGVGNAWRLEGTIQAGQFSGVVTCPGMEIAFRFKSSVGRATDPEIWATRVGISSNTQNQGIIPPTLLLKVSFPAVQVISSTFTGGGGCGGEVVNLVRG